MDVFRGDSVHLFDEKRKEITVLSVAHVSLGSKLSMGMSIAQVLQYAHMMNSSVRMESIRGV